mgnify:CR=1 FL=1|tara:strand:+ start:73 stop:624 length:552 start_codon:yes stop_codon:yes gene_type:complete
MKKITILILFLSFVSNAQNNMQFNRVIDTLLIVDISSGVNINTFPISSTEFSPNTNKIWKINNITMKSLRQPYVVECASGNIYGSAGIFSYLLIDDGVNEIPLCATYSSGVVSSTQNELSDFTSYVCDDIKLPLWINDTSVITLNVNSEYSDDDTENWQPCIDFSNSGKAKVYISLIEFNIVE